MASTRVAISSIAVTQIQELCDNIQELRSSSEESNKREFVSCVNELLGKLELALALKEEIEE